MNTGPLSRTVSLVCCLGALAAQEQAASKHLLRYAFAPGKVAHNVTSQEIAMKMAMGDTERETTMSMQLFMSSTIVDVKDGAALIRMAMDRLKVVSNTPGLDIDYDSDVQGSDAGPLRKMTDMVGKAMEARIDPRGVVREVKVPDELKDAAKGFDLEQMLGQQFQALPEEPVAVGATWVNATTMAMGTMGKARSKVRNKLLEVKGGKATLGQEIEMDFKDLEMPAEMKLEVEKASGTMVIDLTSWILPEGALEIAMVTKGTDMNMHITTKVKMQACEAPKKAAAKEQPPSKKDDHEEQGGK